DRARRERLPRQALPGSAAARCHRAAGRTSSHDADRAPARRARSARLSGQPMAERVTEIYSLLIPLVDGRLIIPRACVAEVIGFVTPSEMTGAPPWYVGTVPWNGRQVPLVSFEGACGNNIPPASGRTRIVVFPCMGTRVDAGYFGIVSQGFPQLVRVSSDVVRPDNSRVFAERAPVICQIRMVNESPLVPDLERLEEMIAEETRISASSTSSN